MLVRNILLIIVLAIPRSIYAQKISGEYNSEWQWNFADKTNWINQFRLNAELSLGSYGTLEASTLHLAKVNNNSIIDDWQVFSNIEEKNMVAAIAVLGYSYGHDSLNLFAGVRNVNEDYFISDVTSFFANSSCGIFPTISATYPIANYPLSGLSLYFEVALKKFTIKNSIYNGSGFNGWNRYNNPFIVNPSKYGVFDVMQLEYHNGKGCYFAGIAYHTKLASAAWWTYAEQNIWETDKNSLSLIAQYSENTDKHNGCFRYGELGGLYTSGKNMFGISGQYAQYTKGSEQSLELSYRRELTSSLSIQPVLQFIKNSDDSFSALCFRLHYDFKSYSM